MAGGPRATIPVKMSPGERAVIKTAALEVGVPASTLMRNGALREAERVRRLRDGVPPAGLVVEYDRLGGGVIVRAVSETILEGGC